MLDRLAILRKMEAEKPTDPFVKYALALELRSMAQYEEAVNYFWLLLQNFPDYLPSYYQFASLLNDLGNAVEAENVYRAGIALAERNGDTKTLAELKQALETMED